MPRFAVVFFVVAVMSLITPMAWGTPAYKLTYESVVEGQTNIFQSTIENPNPVLLYENAEHPSMTSEGVVFFTRYEETVWGDFWKAYYIPGDKRVGVTINTVFTELDPTVSRDGRYVVFQSTRAGTFEIIYVPLSPLEPQVRITQNNTDDVEPTIDGKGQNLYFVVLAKNGESYIYKSKVDGSGQERLSKPGMKDRHPSVDAANRLLAFSSERDGNSEIYVMDLQQRSVKRLTDNEAWDGNPSISSDGRWIAFVSERDGNKEIYIIGSDGKNLTRITDNDVPDDHPALN